MVIIQTIAGTSIAHGGTSRSVPALCDALVDLGCDVHIVTGIVPGKESDSIFPSSRTQLHKCHESVRWGRMLLGRSFAKEIATIKVGSLVHDHGLWLTTNHAVAGVCRQKKIKRIVSPRGMVGSWPMNHGRFKKRLAWLMYQYRDLRTATAFHATSQQEAEEIRNLGFQQPIAVIPNGLEVPSSHFSKRVHGKVRMLFMSRIHPKKGLLNLVNAWHKACMPSSWELVIAGPDEGGFQREVEQLVTSLQLKEKVWFAGPVNDVDKWQAYADSDYFILPSFNENFGIVIAEALMAGLPVITTTRTPWAGIAERKCGWWVEPTVSALQVALSSAARQSDNERQAMGKRGRDYVMGHFSWRKSATDMIDFYQFVQRGFTAFRPSCVV